MGIFGSKKRISLGRNKSSSGGGDDDFDFDSFDSMGDEFNDDHDAAIS